MCVCVCGKVIATLPLLLLHYAVGLYIQHLYNISNTNVYHYFIGFAYLKVKLKYIMLLPHII